MRSTHCAPRAEETKKTESNRSVFEIPNIHCDYKKRNGRLGNSVFNSKTEFGKKESHALLPVLHESHALLPVLHWERESHALCL